MASGQAAGGTGTQLSHLTHDLRSSLSAAVAFLDLARERVERGEAIAIDDLAPVERNLTQLQAKIAELEMLAKGGVR
jgi:signal transduction histidine kinase